MPYLRPDDTRQDKIKRATKNFNCGQNSVLIKNNLLKMSKKYKIKSKLNELT